MGIITFVLLASLPFCRGIIAFVVLALSPPDALASLPLLRLVCPNT
jgi:hypothetical protein